MSKAICYTSELEKMTLKSPNGKAPPIGIDLGTSFSGAAVYKNGKPEMIPDKNGKRLIPSFVFYAQDSLDVSVGTDADDSSTKAITNFLFDIKRIIGRKYDDVYVQKLKASSEYRYNIVSGEDGKAEIELMHDGVKVQKSPEQISSEILKYLRETASEYLGAQVTEAVISVPAHFSNAQRKATKAAAELAGLKVLKLITEPVAAAIHYSEDKQNNGNIVVFDFGGGTLDVSIIKSHDKIFEVKSVEGDTFLGGRDFDQILFQHFVNDMNKKYEKSLISSLLEQDRFIKTFRGNCIKLKEQLSNKNKYDVPVYWMIQNKVIEYTLSLTRSEFETLCYGLIRGAIQIAQTCLKEAGLTKNDIEKVIMVGGTTRIPKVRETVKTFFQKDLKTDLNPDEAVALGAAIQAFMVQSKCKEFEKYKITEVTPLTLGIQFHDNLMVPYIRKNTPLPTQSPFKSSQTGENNQKSALFTIAEGERINCKYNNILGSFTLKNLPAGKHGEVKFESRFTLDEDGILEVEAFETTTMKRNKLVVNLAEFRLCEYKEKHILDDAEKNKKEDEIFEKFVRYKWKVTEPCDHVLYDIDKIILTGERNFVKEKCENFKSLAESLKYTEITKLQKEYQIFRNSIQFLIKGIIDVDFSDA